MNFVIRRFDYPWWIASEGHTSAHVPHSVHISGLIEYLSPSEIGYSDTLCILSIGYINKPTKQQ